MGRTVDKAKFVTMKEGMKPSDAQDFTRYIHKDVDKPGILTAVSRRKHPELTSIEKSGPKWG